MKFIEYIPGKWDEEKTGWIRCDRIVQITLSPIVEEGITFWSIFLHLLDGSQLLHGHDVSEERATEIATDLVEFIGE